MCAGRTRCYDDARWQWMRAIRLETATIEDAAAVASLRHAVADDLTRRYGEGPWSSGRSLSYRAT